MNEAGCGQRARAATTIHTQTALRWRYPRHELCINANWRVMIRCQKSDFQFMPIIAPCMPPRTGSGYSVSGTMAALRVRVGVLVVLCLLGGVLLLDYARGLGKTPFSPGRSPGLFTSVTWPPGAHYLKQHTPVFASVVVVGTLLALLVWPSKA